VHGQGRTFGLFSMLLIFFWRSPASFAAPVLLISIDGMRADEVTRADEHALKIPTLRRFLKEGSWSEGVTGVTPTVTYPSHTTLVTGVAPAEHGIYANGPFDPLLQNNGGWYWYARDVRVRTLWEAAADAGLVTASVSWPVTVAAPGIRYNVPEFGNESTDRVKAIEALSRPDELLNDLEARLGPYTGEGSVEGDRIRTRFALEILKRYKPGFMTVHLLSVDHRSHEHGPFSPETNQALEVVDGLIAELQVAALANNPDAVVSVVSDHGFSPTEHVFNLRIPFIKAGLITLDSPLSLGQAPRIESWKATVWNAGGSAAIMLKDPQDVRLHREVVALLDTLQADFANGIARVLSGDTLKQLGGWPGASFVIDMRPDYFIGNSYSGPEITSAPSSGQHGFLPGDPEMRASFLIIGKEVAHGRNLGTVDMRQIAPTLAKILNVNLSQASLKPLDIEAR
jgi:predicted AlkP superfamily pyrophosphatase or phosphodiesterase